MREELFPLLVALYACCSIAMLMYGFKAYYMVWAFRRKASQMRWLSKLRELRFRKKIANGTIDLPPITTQIPIFNEYNVAERVMRAVAAMDYPRELHQIQVLDDSNDETVEIVDRVAAELSSQGYDIEVVRRADRAGFKAGALKEGMLSAKGEFISIFDADFVPTPDFLINCLSQFQNHPEFGLVQARWGHLNREENLLTRAVALGIDGHFVVEQPARSWNGYFLNFNGTGGLWRRETIEDAGGWRAETLTEDLELSYRAQLKGWKIFFLFDQVVPAEIPSSYEAFKSQQFRWAKGSIQTAKLMLPKILSSDLRFGVKLHSLFHLSQYSMHACMLGVALLSFPLLISIAHLTSLVSYWWALGVLPLIAASIGPSQLYIFSQAAQNRPLWKHIKMLPNLMLIGFGISVSNTHAVLEALIGKKSAFVRTPKRGAAIAKDYKVKKTLIPWFETAMGFYSLLGLSLSLLTSKFFLAPYLLIYAMGFFTVGISSLNERRRKHAL